MLTKDVAICIRAVDYSETSQVVTFFTRLTGKIAAIAKGSKRLKSAFDGPIEIFSYGRIVFTDSNREKLAVLTEFEQQPSFTAISADLFTMNCCLFAAELLDKLTDDYDPHPQLFDRFLQFLHDVSKQQDMLSLLLLFQLSLLREIGMQPVLNTCTNCKTSFNLQHTKYQVYFSSSANGLVCRDCESNFPDKIRLTESAASCLSNLTKIDKAKPKILTEIEKVLIYHFTELLGKPPKMAKHILQKTSFP